MPGEHTLYVYGDAGTAFSSTFTTTAMFAALEAEVMVDLCLETELTSVRGLVGDAKGNASPAATVSVDELFVETETDNEGRYELTLPPGTWFVTARKDNLSAAAEITVSGPQGPDGEIRTVELNLQLD